MKYYIRGEEIDIPVEKKEFKKGSEGKVYRIGDSIYKIYYPNMINEGYGSKAGWHQYLVGIPTKQIILPDDIIFDKNGDYVGYKTKFVSGDQKDKTGVTLMPSEEFVKNLRILENDFNVLTNYYVLAADLTQFNYIFDQKTNLMNIIDPGRYRTTNIEKTKIEEQNNIQLDTLFDLILYSDFIKYKPIGSKRKSQLLKDKIKDDKGNLRYSDYFEEKLEKYDNVDAYVKTLGRYIR